ncbi:MAG: nucleotidyl transferase AbiEii/AbiGii toxin family protein [Candidatus Cloacimonetes bacterium]|nr:nucleotidyl transferase AbiEii/AbiGii toxin family protein [Candidatus Cloacimonadota bacterium]
MEIKELHLELFTKEFHELLLKIMKNSEFNFFYLVGGTALALYLGHRKSIDIDLFTELEFNERRIASILENEYRGQQINIEKGTVAYSINDIKAEFFLHQYPLVGSLSHISGIRLCSIEDLCAFKLNAIMGRGSKKDFWDLAYLLKIYPLEKQIEFFQKKYHNANLWHLQKSLSFFEDADNEGTEILDDSVLSWQEVKEKIREEILNYEF